MKAQPLDDSNARLTTTHIAIALPKDVRPLDPFKSADEIASYPEEVRAFLSSICALAPYLHLLCRSFPQVVRTCHQKGFEQALAEALVPLDDAAGLAEADIMHVLRVAKRQAALVAGLADLGGFWSSDRVGAVMAKVADRSVQTAVNHLLLAHHERGKLSLKNTDDPGKDSGYAVLAMGKHGAGELNYSSDIDLIVFIDPDAPAIVDRDECVTVFNRFTRSLMKIMQQRTADGYVFRTDLRLRPDPGSMPLAIPLGLALTYYESRGQNWERAAMIKARAIAGDVQLGQSILDELRPFVWRRYLDFAAVADIHSIKRQIRTHRGFTSLKAPGHNVKLGRGGIREIEFFVQAQQLIGGGRNPSLRIRQTLPMLNELCRQDWLDEEQSRELQAAYRYLRDVEHRLQMIDDAQTHEVPTGKEDLAVIAALCGHKSAKAFCDELEATLTRVETICDGLGGQEADLSSAFGNLVFTGDDHDPGTLAALSEMGFERPPAIIDIVKGWHFGRYKAMQSTEARERLTQIAPALLQSFAATGRGDDAILAFDRFVKGLPGGFQLFTLLHANPRLLGLLAQIMGVAPRLEQIITRRPHVFDSLLEPGFFDTMPDRASLSEQLQTRLDACTHYEDGLDRARLFASEQKFRIGTRLLSGAANAAETAQAFSTLADACIDVMVPYVEAVFAERHGFVPGGEMAIVALGNWGAGGLTAGSDLDMLVVYRYPEDIDASDGERPLDPSQYYGRLCQRLIAALGAPSADGVMYELDLRLRPYGTKGPLASSLRALRGYYERSADIWERLAMTRARIVRSSGDIASDLDAALDEIVKSAGEPTSIARKTLGMRKQMDAERSANSCWDVKLATGGLIDLEFLGQWAVLAGIAERKEALPEILGQLRETILPNDNVNLVEAYAMFSGVQHLLRVCLTEAPDKDVFSDGLQQRLVFDLEQPDLAHAEQMLATTQMQVRKAFGTILKAQH